MRSSGLDRFERITSSDEQVALSESSGYGNWRLVMGYFWRFNQSEVSIFVHSIGDSAIHAVSSIGERVLKSGISFLSNQKHLIVLVQSFAIKTEEIWRREVMEMAFDTVRNGKIAPTK